MSAAIAESFARIAEWLELMAPRTRATLLPAATPDELAAVANAVGRTLPPSIEALYRASSGQRPDVAPVFGNYYFMALHGVDGLESEWECSPPELVPFAKDYGGNSLCVDEGNGTVVELLEGEAETISVDLQSYLAELADRMEQGAIVLDDTIEEIVGTYEVVLDPTAEHRVGDRIDDPILARLGITATVEDPEVHRSRFDTHLYRFEFFVRLAPMESVKIGAVTFEVRQGAPPRDVEAGSGSGGGRPGNYVFARRRERPMPAGSTLRVVLRKIRRV